LIRSLLVDLPTFLLTLVGLVAGAMGWLRIPTKHRRRYSDDIDPTGESLTKKEIDLENSML